MKQTLGYPKSNLTINIYFYLSELPHHRSWSKHWAVPIPPMVQILFHHYCTHRMVLLPIVFSPFKNLNILYNLDNKNNSMTDDCLIVFISL